MNPGLDLATLKERVGAIPDFPQPGIVFRDITTLLADGASFAATIDHLVESVIAETSDIDADRIDGFAGIESRGFIFAAALAYRLNTAMIAVRKPGKLPRPTLSVDYTLEYGTDQLHVHRDDVPNGANIIIVDDLIATGGTAVATAQLLREAGAVVDHALFVIALTELPGLAALADVSVNAHHLIGFGGH